MTTIFVMSQPEIMMISNETLTISAVWFHNDTGTTQ